MKTILVTGGLGFIGSNFLNSYVSNNLDKNIINIDSESYASSFESTKNLTNYSNYKYLNIDITHQSDINSLFNSYEFDIIEITHGYIENLDSTVNNTNIYLMQICWAQTLQMR